jgi:hypothetical protein
MSRRRILISKPEAITDELEKTIEDFDKEQVLILLKYRGAAVFGESALFEHPFAYHLALKDILKKRNLSFGEFVVNAIINEVEKTNEQIKKRYGIDKLTPVERKYFMSQALLEPIEQEFWCFHEWSTEDTEGNNVDVIVDVGPGAE